MSVQSLASSPIRVRVLGKRMDAIECEPSALADLFSPGIITAVHEVRSIYPVDAATATPTKNEE